MTAMTTNGNGSRRAELAAFLRSRRERISPEQVGLPPGLRRRTPGLRREEVAQLAGVGVTWYTWLEQGRPIKASARGHGDPVRAGAARRPGHHGQPGAAPGLRVERAV